MQDLSLAGRGNRAALALLLHAFLLFGTGVLAGQLSQVLGFTLTALGQLLSAAVGVWVLLPLTERPRRKSQRLRGTFPLWLLLLLGAVALGQGISLLLSQIPPLSDLLAPVSPPASPWEWGTVLLGSVLLPAVCEECFFRFAMLSALRPAGEAAAVTLSAIAFAVLHLPTSMLSALLAGAVLGCFALRFPLWQSILLHLLANLAAVFLSFFSENALVPAVLVLIAVSFAAWLCLCKWEVFFSDSEADTAEAMPVRFRKEIFTPALCLSSAGLLLVRIFAYR